MGKRRQVKKAIKRQKKGEKEVKTRYQRKQEKLIEKQREVDTRISHVDAIENIHGHYKNEMDEILAYAKIRKTRKGRRIKRIRKN